MRLKQIDWQSILRKIMVKEKVSKISFQELSNCKTQYSGLEVVVKGFVYENREGIAILADEPNLKTCCIGSLNNHPGQIMLSGFRPTEKSHQVVALQGKLYSDGQGYRLEQAALIQEALFPMNTVKILLIITIFAGFFLNRRKFNIFKHSA